MLTILNVPRDGYVSTIFSRRLPTFDRTSQLHRAPLKSGICGRKMSTAIFMNPGNGGTLSSGTLSKGPKYWTRERAEGQDPKSHGQGQFSFAGWPVGGVHLYGLFLDKGTRGR